MFAMVLRDVGQRLIETDISIPLPGIYQVLIKVRACGICRTDLHILDGELPNPKLPLILGHQIVGNVVSIGDEVESFSVGDRVGVAWLGSTCGQCKYCLKGQENLCDEARFTGYKIDGGYAEYTVANEKSCFHIPSGYPDIQAAPLLCAGLIGYRALDMVDNSSKIGFYGFGSAAHILTQVARYQGQQVFAFTKPGDIAGQKFAVDLGAAWAGDTTQLPPEQLDAAIIFASAGELVPLALRTVCKGGTVVCAGIHMSDIPSFPYEFLWGERSIKSVANLTRKDGTRFMELAPKIPVKTTVQSFPLLQANQALNNLREGKIQGSAVFDIQSH